MKKSIITGKEIPDGAAFVEDAEGNFYLAEEYSIAVDVAVEAEGEPAA